MEEDSKRCESQLGCLITSIASKCYLYRRFCVSDYPNRCLNWQLDWKSMGLFDCIQIDILAKMQSD